MKYLILLLISANLLALEINDRMANVSVIKHYKGNVIVLNRGLEDAINKYDHIKLTNTNGYIARAICVKSSMMLSYWKVYRVVNPELLSYDPSYTLNSMLQSELPPHMKRYVDKLVAKNNDSEYFDDKIKDEDLKKQVELQQDRIVKFDLVNDMKDEPYKKDMPTESEQFLNKNFDSKRLAKDLSTTKIRLFASPIRFQSEDQEKSSNYGAVVSNDGTKYGFDTFIQKTDEKTVNNFTKETVESSETLSRTNFTINNISKNFSYFAHVYYNSRTEGDVDYPESLLQVGFLGFMYHGEEDPKKRQFDIGYTPLLDYLKTDIKYPEEKSLKENNLRHGLRIRANIPMTNKLSLNSLFWYKPLMDLGKFEMDWEDNKTYWRTSLRYSISEDFFVSYDYEYINDIRRKREFKRDEVNTINTLNLNYTISL
jgi:hypothetical protein